MNWLIRAWYEKNPLLYLLWPFSLLYQLIVSIKRAFYELSIRKQSHFNKPIIVVGNITVGGTGKTPLVIALAHYLQAQGYHPGIVSRGYKAKAKHFPQWVEPNSDVRFVGDEPLLIAQRTNCPVVISPYRSEAVKLLLNSSHCDVVLSDDGLQHYALARDIEILVIDGERRVGNGLCLPAGPLRESTSRLQAVDFIVTNGYAAAGEFCMHLKSDAICQINDPNTHLDIATIKQPIHAIAAIGNPMRFFNQLRAMGLQIIEHIFPDHYFFTKKDIDFENDDIVIMTEKDAVKCKAIADARHWFLRISAELDSAFYRQLLDKLKDCPEKS